jgi:hypothetical protein
MGVGVDDHIPKSPTTKKPRNWCSREIMGSYWALKGHLTSSQGDHWDRVHSDQMVLTMVRRGRYSQITENCRLKIRFYTLCV